MADITNDFQTYPKYRFTQKGDEIQEILDVASDTFGMLYNLDPASIATFPSILQTVGGAEHLQNTSGSKILFIDQINPEEPEGKIYLDLGDTTIPAAIGNYATVDSIKNLFTENTSIEVLAPKETPEATFSDDYKCILVVDQSTGEPIQDPETVSRLDLYRFDVITTSGTSDTFTTERIFQGKLDIPNVDIFNTAQQRIEVVALGDNYTTKDSLPNAFYRICLGIPVIQDINDTNAEIVYFTLKRPVACESLLPSHIEMAPTTINYKTINIDYTKAAIEDALTISTDNYYSDGVLLSASCTENTGTAIAASLATEGVRQLTGDPVDETEVDHFRIMQPSVKLVSKLNTLPAPTINAIGISQPRIEVAYDTSNLLGDVLLYYSIKHADETEFSSYFRLTDMIRINAGDTIRVKACAVPTGVNILGFDMPLYNNSQEVEYTHVNEEFPSVDLVASNIAFAEAYAFPEEEAWFKLF